LAASANARRRFAREARAAAAVTHEHVVTIHGVDSAGGLPYLVMEYVSGRSLQQHLDECGPLPLAEVLRIGAETADALASARDLAPGTPPWLGDLIGRLHAPDPARRFQSAAEVAGLLRRPRDVEQPPTWGRRSRRLLAVLAAGLLVALAVTVLRLRTPEGTL